jgi:ATP-binding cassette subfamily B protein
MGTAGNREAKLSGLLRMARPHRGLIITAGLLASVSAVLSLTPAVVFAYAARPHAPGGSVQSLLPLAGLALAALAARWMMMAGAFACSHIAAYRLLYDLRIAIANKLTRMPLGDVTARQSGAIKKILQEDVERIELFVAHIMVDAFGAAALPLASLLLLLTIDPWMAAAALSPLPLALICQVAMYRDVDEQMRRYTRASEAMNAALVEFVNAIPVVKVFNVETRSLTALFQSIEDYRRLLIGVAQKVVPSWSLFKLVMRSTILVVAAVGALRFQSGYLTMIDLVLCLMVGAGLLQPVMRLLFAGSLLRMIEHGALRVRDILEGPELSQPSAAKVPADASVAFEGVSFSYRSTPALHDVTFRIPAGRTVALVGRSGAGKSTVARLVARFWDPTEGAVEIGGVNITDIPSESLGRWVSFVFQEVFLFDDTVRENVRLGLGDCTQDAIVEAAKAAGAHDFIAALPRGYDTVIGEKGARLSGGERQRLSIARALLRNAPVLVLDEMTAHADATTEAALVSSLGRFGNERTILLITHRPALLARADEVFLLDGGRLAARGRHSELMAQNELYQTLFRRPAASALVEA